MRYVNTKHFGFFICEYKIKIHFYFFVYHYVYKTYTFFKFNFLHLLVLGSTVVTCDPGPGAVPVRTFGGNTSGLWYLGGHALHPERNKKSPISLPQTTADNYILKGCENCSYIADDIPKNN